MAEQAFKIGDRVHFEHWTSKPGSPWVVDGTITDIEEIDQFGYSEEMPRVTVDAYFTLRGFERLRPGPSEGALKEELGSATAAS